MLALKIALALAAVWSGLSYVVLCGVNHRKVTAGFDSSTGSRAAGMALIGFILAVGLLGVLVK
jgi:hypothetical protein